MKVADLEDWGPCWPEDRIEALAGDKEDWTWADVKGLRSALTDEEFCWLALRFLVAEEEVDAMHQIYSGVLVRAGNDDPQSYWAKHNKAVLASGSAYAMFTRIEELYADDDDVLAKEIMCIKL